MGNKNCRETMEDHVKSYNVLHSNRLVIKILAVLAYTAFFYIVKPPQLVKLHWVYKNVIIPSLISWVAGFAVDAVVNMTVDRNKTDALTEQCVQWQNDPKTLEANPSRVNGKVPIDVDQVLSYEMRVTPSNISDSNSSEEQPGSVAQQEAQAQAEQGVLENFKMLDMNLVDSLDPATYASARGNSRYNNDELLTSDVTDSLRNVESFVPMEVAKLDKIQPTLYAYTPRSVGDLKNNPDYRPGQILYAPPILERSRAQSYRLGQIHQDSQGHLGSPLL